MVGSPTKEVMQGVVRASLFFSEAPATEEKVLEEDEQIERELKLQHM